MDQIKSISVEIRSDEAFVVDNRDMPNICLQHLVALYLVDRKLTFDSAHDYSRMDDPRVRDIRSKIQLIASEALMKSGGRQAIVKITTHDEKLCTNMCNTYAVLGAILCQGQKFTKSQRFVRASHRRSTYCAIARCALES